MTNNISETFSKYMSVCDEKGLSGDSRLTFDEFSNLMSGESVPHDKVKKLVSLVMPQRVVQYGDELVSGANQRISSELSNALGETLGLDPRLANFAGEVVYDAGQRLWEAGKTAVGTRMEGSGGGGKHTSTGYGSGGGSYEGLEIGGMRGDHGWAMADRVPPIEAKLDTGIVPNAYSTDRETPLLNSSSEAISIPLHIQCIEVKIPEAGFSEAWFETLQTFRIRNQAQANVSFSIPDTKLTDTALRNYFNVVINALSVYYTYESVIAYTESYFNRNKGLFEIRQNIQANQIFKLIMLRKLLESTPIPRNMFMYIYWLFCHYRTTPTAEGAILKFSAVDFNKAGDTVDSPVQDAIDALNSINITASLLRRTFPAWQLGNIPGSPSDTLHDSGFSTLFWNTGYVYNYTDSSGTVTTLRYPNVSSYVTPYYMGIYDNELDGAITSSISYYDTSNSEWTPALIKPVASALGSSRLIYTHNSTDGDRFDNWFTETRRDCVGDYTHSGTSTATSGYSRIRSSCQALLGVTANTISESLIKVMEWFMTWEDTKKRPDRRNSLSENMEDTSGRSKPKRRRRSKGKPKT